MSRYLVPSLRTAVFERDGFRCKKCGFHAPDEVGLDCNHVTPVTKGGRDEIDNLDTLCGICHAELSWIWLDDPPVPYQEWLKLTPAASLIRTLLLMRGGDVAPPGMTADLARTITEGATGLTAEVARRLIERAPR